MRSAVLLAGLAALAGCGESPPRKTVAPSDFPDTAADAPHQVPARPVPPPTLVDTATKQFTARGTEPFWLIAVRQGQLRYSSPDRPDGVVFAATATRSGRGYRYAGTLRGAIVQLYISPGNCSDGMSETVYAFTAQLVIGAQALRGCAEAG